MIAAKTPAAETKERSILESALATRIPYTHLLDEETVETKNGSLLQVIKLEGLAADTLDDREIDQQKHIRNALLKSITDASIALYFHTIRKKYEPTLIGNFPDGYAKALNGRWQNKFKSKQLFINEHYITLVKKPPVNKIHRITDIFNALSGTVNKAAREAYRSKSHQDINKTTAKIISHLSSYGARKIGLSEMQASGTIYSEILSFLAELINLEAKPLLLPLIDISRYLPYKRIFFDEKTGTIALRKVGGQSCYAAILSIKHYDPTTCAGMLDHLLDIKNEFIITQSFCFLDKAEAKKKIEENQRNQAQSDDGNATDYEDINQTLEQIAGSRSSSGEHHFTLLCKENSLTELGNAIAKIDAALSEIGIIAVREDVGVKLAYFAMLPGNHAYIPRPAIISSKNMANYASLHGLAIGKPNGHHWGDAITILETISGTPFYFSFHVKDVGNTILIGPMGSGKTLLEAFLLTQSQKLGGRTIILDEGRGLEIAVRANGGAYSIMTPGERTGFSPFQMDDTADNRYFLAQLMQKIATTINTQPLTDDEVARIKLMIAGAFELPQEQRFLRHIVPFLGMRKAGSLRARFDHWVNNGDYAWVFDNEIDHFSLATNMMGIDMSAVLADSLVRNVIYFYLFHRIEQKMDGTRTRITLAEGWKILQDKECREKIKEWSSTPRKKETLLMIDTQSPNDIAQSLIGSKIIQESVTQIFFGNPKARREDYIDKFGLSEKEFQILQEIGPFFFLLKQGKTSIVVRADLSEMKDDIAILSGRTRSVKLLDQIRHQVGDDPNKWLPIFLEQVHQLAEVP